MTEQETQARGNSLPSRTLVQQYRWFLYIPYLNAVVLSGFYFTDTGRAPRPLRKWRILAWCGGFASMIVLALPIWAVYVGFQLPTIQLMLMLMAYQLLGTFWLALAVRILDRLFRKRRENDVQNPNKGGNP